MADKGKKWKPKFLLQNLSEEEKEETLSNVAWRIINIYRQIHLFSPEEVEKYNQMLMEVSSELAMMISDYPGGDEVAKYMFYIKGEEDNSTSELDENTIKQEKAKARILAEALAQHEGSRRESASESSYAPATSGVSKRGGSVTENFSRSLPPVPSITGPISITAEKTSMEDVARHLADAQIKASEMSTSAMTEALSRVINESQETSTRILADALSKVTINTNAHINSVENTNYPVGIGKGNPIDVSYSTPLTLNADVFSMEEVARTLADAQMRAAEANSNTMATAISKAITESQEASTRVLASLLAQRTASEIGYGSNVQEGIVNIKGMFDADSMASFANMFSERISDGIVQAIHSSQEANLRAISEIVSSISQSNSNVNMNTIANAIVEGIKEAKLTPSKIELEIPKIEMPAPTIEGINVQGMKVEGLAGTMDMSENMIAAFAKTFADAQLQVSYAQTSNLAEAFAKAATISQEKIANTLAKIVQDISMMSPVEGRGGSLSADDISGIVSSAIGQLGDVMIRSEPIYDGGGTDLALALEKVLATFTEAQIEFSRKQSETFEKLVSSMTENISRKDSAIEAPRSDDVDTDTYRETWIGGDAEALFDGEETEPVNMDVFDSRNMIEDEQDGVSLDDILSVDPYNLLMKQKKLFQEHKVLYDSGVGLHVAYPGAVSRSDDMNEEESEKNE